MRDYQNIERYLNELAGDIYEQPPDAGHTEMAQWVIDNWISSMSTCKTVLDVGAGQGFTQPMFAKLGMIWTGVTLGKDYLICKEMGLDIHNADMSFLPFNDNSFDLLFVRHTLEHSSMPLLSLMEFERVSKQWVCIILPDPNHYGYTGRNHYSVMTHVQLVWLAARAGLKPIWELIKDNEIRVMFEKGQKKLK